MMKMKTTVTCLTIAFCKLFYKFVTRAKQMPLEKIILKTTSAVLTTIQLTWVKYLSNESDQRLLAVRKYLV